MSDQTTVQATEQQAPQRNKFASEKKKRKMPRWLKVLIPVLIVAAIVFGAYTVAQRLTARQDPTVIEGTVMGSSLSDQITGWSTISAKQTAEYGVGLTGTITEIAVDPGQTVEPGDLLFVIDPEALRASLESAEKVVASAQRVLEEAAGKLAYTSVNAPFTGKLLAPASVKVGDRGTEGMTIGTLVDDRTMRLELYFSRGFFGQIRTGQAATVSLPAQMREVAGTVSGIDDIERPIDGSLCFRVYIDFENPGVLAAGDTASASVTTAAGVVTPVAAGTMDYSRTEILTLRASGDISYSDMLEYGSYAAGQRLLAIDTTELLEEIETAQTAYDEAERAAQQLRERVQNTEIRSDITGMVSGLVIEVGTKVESSPTPLVTVSNTSSLLMRMNVDELDISKLSLGMTVDISSDSGAYAMGTIIDISYTANVSTDSWSGMSSTFPVTVSLENDGSLLPGMSVNYTITSLVKDYCLVVPSTAVTYIEDGSTVVYVKRDENFSYEAADLPADETIPEDFYPVIVTTGLSDAYNTEIEGLEEGTTVYAGRASNEGYWG